MTLSQGPAAMEGEQPPMTSRVDPERGMREVVEFFGSDQSRLFGCSYLPAGRSRGGVIVCPSVQAEFHRNYRREVELGRHLAAQGFAVQRFHYRGTGHSDGETSDVTFETMIEDAISAAEHLRERSSVGRLGFIGTRSGALVAAAAASQSDGSPVALWEPVTDPNRYVRDILRAGLIHELRKGVHDNRSRNEQIEELLTTGKLDVLGYTINRGLYESLVRRELDGELGSTPRPLLLVEIARRSELRREYSAAVERWASRGFDVSTHIVSSMAEPWWFVRGRSIDEEASLTRDLVQTTAAWFSRTLASTGVSG
jgi:acetyl esterase/lipase